MRGYCSKLLPDRLLADTVHLTPQDIRVLSGSMQTYYDTLCEAVSTAVGPRDVAEPA